MRYLNLSERIEICVGQILIPLRDVQVERERKRGRERKRVRKEHGRTSG